ncbi:disulfide bond formation protein DsbA [Microbacterium sp. Gd 4-13]|nr:disulfide bond formation protein DsbA [Microbacterium sp. Gd 4-13]
MGAATTYISGVIPHFSDDDETSKVRSPAIRIEVWSDVQCVWCYVGDARLRRAVEAFAGEVEIEHRSFELQPGFPSEVDATEYLRANRGMDDADQERVFSQMKTVAAAEGLQYEPQSIRPTNSHLALEMLHYAQTQGVRRRMSDRLYRAYFVEGHHLGSVDALVELAGDAGLDPERARAVLTAGTYRAAVDRDADTARALGARGVPFMVVDDRFAIPGALGTEELTQLLTRVAEA